VIDQKALYEHLRANPEFVACIDVWRRYPKRGEETCFQDRPFHELPNIIMTPHIAGFAREVRPRVIRCAAENIRAYIISRRPKNIVDRSDYL